MKRISIALIALSLLALPAMAQPTITNPWVGLWQSSSDDPPGVILTLGDDNGRLAGAVVFNLIAHDLGKPRVLARDAHSILNPRVEGDTLRFEVIRRSDSRILDMTVHMTADGKATFHCQNCGDSPEVEITRER